jgi:hypothetical protein
MILHCWLSIRNKYPSAKFAMLWSARVAKRNCLLAVLHVSQNWNICSVFNGSVCRINHGYSSVCFSLSVLLFFKKNQLVVTIILWPVVITDQVRSLTTQAMSMFWHWGKLMIGHYWHISTAFLFGLDLDAFVLTRLLLWYAEGCPLRRSHSTVQKHFLGGAGRWCHTERWLIS